MLCQHCKAKTATTHVRRTINGKTAEYHLCAECAEKQGLGGVLGGVGLDIGNFWSSLFAEPAARTRADALRCERCGCTFADIARTGKVGCADCYDVFYDRLLPSIQRIHGKAQHGGKLGVTAGEEPRRDQELEKLKEELERCVEAQQYERCAELRDRIRELEKETGKGGNADE